QLAFVERLTPLAALHHRRQLQLGRFVGVEALAALRTLAPATHARTVIGQARIDHAGVVMLAEGAVHGQRVSSIACAKARTGGDTLPCSAWRTCWNSVATKKGWSSSSMPRTSPASSRAL